MLGTVSRFWRDAPPSPCRSHFPALLLFLRRTRKWQSCRVGPLVSDVRVWLPLRACGQPSCLLNTFCRPCLCPAGWARIAAQQKAIQSAPGFIHRRCALPRRCYGATDVCPAGWALRRTLPPTPAAPALRPCERPLTSPPPLLPAGGDLVTSKVIPLLFGAVGTVVIVPGLYNMYTGQGERGGRTRCSALPALRGARSARARSCCLGQLPAPCLHSRCCGTKPDSDPMAACCSFFTPAGKLE